MIYRTWPLCGDELRIFCLIYPLQALRLSSSSRQTSATGEIVNLMSVDAQRFMDLMSNIHIVWSGPYQIIMSLIFLYVIMGPSIFAGFAVMVVMVPISGVLASFSKKLQAKQMKNKDSRIKLVNEVLNGIKVSLQGSKWWVIYNRLIAHE